MLETIIISAAVLLRIISNPLGNVFQKQLAAHGYHPLLINFVTYLLLSSACLVMAGGIGLATLSHQFWLFALLGGIAGALGNGFLIKALQKGELSVLGPINAYKSVVGIITGIFILGEMPNVWAMAGVAIIIYGSYIVLDTTEERFSFSLLKKSEIQYRIWAMLLTGVEAVFIKKVMIASSALIAFFTWCWFGALFSFLLLILNRVPLKTQFNHVTQKDIKMLLLLVISMGTMQLTTNFSLSHIPVGYALSLFQLSIIVSVFLGHRIFKEKDVRRKLIGSLIMIAGSVLIIAFKSQ